jgi:hypothetical protein
MVEGRAVVFDLTQCDAIGHHYHILPFVGKSVERLRVCVG